MAAAELLAATEAAEAANAAALEEVRETAAAEVAERDATIEGLWEDASDLDSAFIATVVELEASVRELKLRLGREAAAAEAKLADRAAMAKVYKVKAKRDAAASLGKNFAMMASRSARALRWARTHSEPIYSRSLRPYWNPSLTSDVDGLSRLVILLWYRSRYRCLLIAS